VNRDIKMARAAFIDDAAEVEDEDNVEEEEDDEDEIPRRKKKQNRAEGDEENEEGEEEGDAEEVATQLFVGVWYYHQHAISGHSWLCGWWVGSTSSKLTCW
jgi:hypothetical protein